MRRLLCLLCLTVISFSIFAQNRRLALVIGNSDYKNAGPLRTPANDAYAMRNELRQTGFEVLDYYDLDHQGLTAAIDDYRTKMENYDVGLVFYAGHGIQANGVNYLIPVDADISPNLLVADECVRVDRIFALKGGTENKVNIMILDAGRNSPFERSWYQTSEGNGLAMMDVPRGRFIAFSTTPGQTAADGDGDNGIYIEAILESMGFSNISIDKLFKNVSVLVSQRSDNLQIPWSSNGIKGKFYLKNISEPEKLSKAERKAEKKNKPASYKNKEIKPEFNSYRAGIILQSLAVPGLGLSRATGKPHWIKGVAGYGCLAGSVVLNRLAVKTYEDFDSEIVYFPEDADRLLSRSVLQDNISETLAYTAIGIWVMDIVWTVIASSDLTNDMSSSRNMGLSIKSGVDPLFKVPVVGISYRF